MIVAAWVSCCRFSVTVSPLRVVAVSESGIGPTAREPGVQTAAVAGVPPSVATPSRIVDGAQEQQGEGEERELLHHGLGSAERVVEL
jgi:hypothetical protein